MESQLLEIVRRLKRFGLLRLLEVVNGNLIPILKSKG
jgi:hypothetical protein